MICKNQDSSYRSSAESHLGCSCVLVTVNDAAANMQVLVSLLILFSFPLDMYPGGGLLDHMVVLRSVCEKLSYFSCGCTS